MRQYNRAEELVKQNFISKASADTALANANSAKSAANAAQVLLSYDTIRSPITGKAGVINVFPDRLSNLAMSCLPPQQQQPPRPSVPW